MRAAPPVALVFRIPDWPVARYLTALTPTLEPWVLERGCFIIRTTDRRRSRLFERHPEPRLPADVADAGMDVVRTLGYAHIAELYRGVLDDSASTTLQLTFGFHATEGLEAVARSFAADGFRVVPYDRGWRDVHLPADPAATLAGVERALSHPSRDPKRARAVRRYVVEARGALPDESLWAVVSRARLVAALGRRPERWNEVDRRILDVVCRPEFRRYRRWPLDAAPEIGLDRHGLLRAAWSARGYADDEVLDAALSAAWWPRSALFWLASESARLPALLARVHALRPRDPEGAGSAAARLVTGLAELAMPAVDARLEAALRSRRTDALIAPAGRSAALATLAARRR